MKITRRFAVATLLVIAVAVVLGAAAPASASQVKLRPPADGPFPNAIGQVNLSMERGSYPGVNSISVSKLGPNTSYYMPVYFQNWYFDYYLGWQWEWVLGSYEFQTDARGAYKSGN